MSTTSNVITLLYMNCSLTEPLGGDFVCLFYVWYFCLFVLLILILSEISKSTMHSTWYCAEHAIDCSLC